MIYDGPNGGKGKGAVCDSGFLSMVERRERVMKKLHQFGGAAKLIDN